MSLKKLNQTGATHLVLILAVVVVAAVAFAGYRVMSADDTAEPAVSTTQSDAFKSTADVDQASKDLDSEDIDSSLDSSELDADMNDLL